MKNTIRVSGVSSAIKNTLALNAGNHELFLQTDSRLSVKIASTQKEREDAYKLAYEEYLKKGYTEKKWSKLLIKGYDFDSLTTVFIGKDESGKVIATATLVFNKTTQLPVNKIFHEELEVLGASGENLVEVCRLVINSEAKKSKEILTLLFNYMFVYGYRVREFDSTVIQVNPRHISYYEKLLQFKAIGTMKACPDANQAPAILLFLPLIHYFNATHFNKAQIGSPKSRSLYLYFLNKEKEDFLTEYLRKQRSAISEDEKKYFNSKGNSNGICVEFIHSLKDKMHKVKDVAPRLHNIFNYQK